MFLLLVLLVLLLLLFSLYSTHKTRIGADHVKILPYIFRFSKTKFLIEIKFHILCLPNLQREKRRESGRESDQSGDVRVINLVQRSRIEETRRLGRKLRETGTEKNAFFLCLSPFLDAPSHLYKRSCPSVRPSVRPSVCPVLFSDAY